jgi:hypothetical protein
VWSAREVVRAWRAQENLAHGLSPRPRKRRTIYGSADHAGPPDDDVEADAALVAELLDVPEAKVAQLLDDLEVASCLVSATGKTL